MELEYDSYEAALQLPYNPQAEQSLLGAILKKPALLDHLPADMCADDFTVRHSRIFSALSTLTYAGKPVDVVTVAEELSKSGEDELDYLTDLTTNTVGGYNVSAYAEIITDCATQRKAHRVGIEIQRLAYDEEIKGSDELVQAASAAMSTLERTGGNEGTEINPILKDRVDAIDRRFRGTEPLGLPTGFNDLDEKIMGMQSGELIILAGRPSMGKAQPLYSKILLDNGTWKAMQDIEIGDNLASEDGEASIVTGVFPQGVRPVCRINLCDGRYVDADEEHLWAVGSCRWKSERVITTKELISKLSCVRYKGRIFVSSHNGSFGSDSKLEIDPWVLGVMLGDGCMSGGLRISNSETYIINKFKGLCGAKLKKVDHRCDYSISNELRIKLSKLGLMGKKSFNKFIPEEYFTSTKINRQRLLAGMLETDGWVERFGSVQFCTVSRDLADGVKRLVHSLGGSCRERLKSEPKYSYKGETRTGRDAYCLTIILEGIDGIIESPRLQGNLTNRRVSAKTKVRSVKYLGDMPTQCISVSHGKKTYITDGYVKTHNTTLAMNVAENTAMADKNVLVFSIEMTKESLTDRMISSASRVPLARIRSGKLLEDDWAKLEVGVRKLKDKKITVNDLSGMTINRLQAIARKLNRKSKIDLVVVDYLQKVGAQKESTIEILSAVSGGLKELAKQIEAPVMAVAQLNRSVEQRPNKRPVMSDLKGSGDIEQDADLVLLAYRDEYYNEDSPQKGIAEIIIGKQRNGETTTVRLASKLEYNRFENLSPDYCPPQPDPKPYRKKGYSI